MVSRQHAALAELRDDLTGLGMVEGDDVGATRGRVVAATRERPRRQRPASARARAWSSARRSTIVSSATSPAAARMPAWRIAPAESLALDATRAPSGRRARRAASPTGAHRPLDRHAITVVARRRVRRAARVAGRDDGVEESRTVEVDGPVPDGARQRRRGRVERRSGVPPEAMCVFSTRHHRDVGLVVVLRVDDVDAPRRASSAPVVSSTSANCTDALRAAAPISKLDHVLATPGDDDVAGRGEHAQRRSGCAMTPEGTKTAASLPTSCGVALLERARPSGPRRSRRRPRRRRHRLAHRRRSAGSRCRCAGRRVESWARGYRRLLDWPDERRHRPCASHDATNVHDHLGMRVVEASPDEVVLAGRRRPARCTSPSASCTAASRRCSPRAPRRSAARVSVGPDEVVVGTELNCSHLRSMRARRPHRDGDAAAQGSHRARLGHRPHRRTTVA